MTNPVSDHYEKLLAPIYSWMVGDFEEACAQADRFYRELALPDGKHRMAVDLGCGHGVHAVPLARRGYRVVGIDSSPHLLGELRLAAGTLPIQTVQGDLIDFPDYLDGQPPALIVCMGDTLTHLPSVEAVDLVIRSAAEALESGGILAFSFRDYATRELAGQERFLPVRADEQRIHVCFLEYLPTIVQVHDLVHSRCNSGWETAVSVYPKLRLPPERVMAVALANGLTLRHQAVNRGMLHWAFEKCSAGRTNLVHQTACLDRGSTRVAQG